MLRIILISFCILLSINTYSQKSETAQIHEKVAKVAVQSLDRNLDLNVNQENEVYKFALKFYTKVAESSSKFKNNEDQRAIEWQKARNEYVKNINSILTPSQKIKYKSLRKDDKVIDYDEK